MLIFCIIYRAVSPACRTRTPECGRFSGHISLARSTQAPEKQHTEDCLTGISPMAGSLLYVVSHIIIYTLTLITIFFT